MMIETSRLVLKPLSLDDAKSLFLYACDPEIAYWAGWKVHESVEQTEYVITHFLNKPYCFGIFIDECAVGCIDLRFPFENSSIGEMGFWIGRPFWNQGYMTEAARAILDLAFCELHVSQMVCAYYEGNKQSAAVQKKLGFVFSHTEFKGPAKRLSFVNVLSSDSYLAQVHK